MSTLTIDQYLTAEPALVRAVQCDPDDDVASWEADRRARARLHGSF